MKEIRQTSQFRKDLKRYRNDVGKLQKLSQLLLILQNGEAIPPSYKPHPLGGDFKGCLECHIENDFLLIWIDKDYDIIGLVRLGSHSELFGKGAKR